MKKIIGTVVIGLIAAIAVGVWYFSDVDTSLTGTNSEPLVQGSETIVPTTNPEELKGKNSILSLLGLGKSMECTFVFTGEGMRSEGAGFFNNGMARIDSLYVGSEADIKNMASYMIIDSSAKIMYTWFTHSGVTQGIKMSTEQNEQMPKSTPGQKDGAAPSQVTPDSNVQYDCRPWKADTSVFVPPADVKFTDMTDMSKMMEGMKKEMGGMNVPNMP